MTNIILGMINKLLTVLTNMVHGMGFLGIFQHGIEGMLEAGSYVTQLLQMVNFIVPIDTIYMICVLTISVNVILWGIWLVNRLIRFFEGVIP